MVVSVAIGTPASRRDAARVVGPPSMPPQDVRAHRARRERGRHRTGDATAGRRCARDERDGLVGREIVAGVVSLSSVRPVWGCLGVDGGCAGRAATRVPETAATGGRRSTAGRGVALGPSSRPSRDACSAPSDACAVEPHGRCRAWARPGGLAGSSVLRCRRRCPGGPRGRARLRPARSMGRPPARAPRYNQRCCTQRVSECARGAQFYESAAAELTR